ncbi:unnamed protein product [Lactuca virosa]|nr:unnamed protein product [Lactuca virosa]
MCTGPTQYLGTVPNHGIVPRVQFLNHSNRPRHTVSLAQSHTLPPPSISFYLPLSFGDDHSPVPSIPYPPPNHRLTLNSIPVDQNQRIANRLLSMVFSNAHCYSTSSSMAVSTTDDVRFSDSTRSIIPPIPPTACFNSPKKNEDEEQRSWLLKSASSDFFIENLQDPPTSTTFCWYSDVDRHGDIKIDQVCHVYSGKSTLSGRLLPFFLNPLDQGFGAPVNQNRNQHCCRFKLPIYMLSTWK